MRNADGSRPWTFWLLAALFTLFVLFLYGPMTVIYILSFQGPQGGMTFPMNGFSFEWFDSLFEQKRVGDIAGAFVRSIQLALVVAVITVVLSVLAGLGFRRRFRGSAFAFYLVIASLIMPGLFVGLGIALTFQMVGLETNWFSSGLGAQLTWTLPFGLLIMFAVFNRFDKAYEEAARDQGATGWQTLRHVVVPIIAPSLVGVGLLGFTLSYDEFARSLLAVGTDLTLPLSIYGMTTNITTPVLYALGTVTTGFSFAVIATFLIATRLLQRRTQATRRRAAHT